MLTRFESNFLVMPEHTNSMSPMIFGGAFFSQMDLCAANAVKRLLYSSNFCETAVTHKFEGTYYKPCYLGDLIFLEADIVELRKKAVVVQVKAFKEIEDRTKILVAECRFVFVSVHNEEGNIKYVNHGLNI